MDNTLEKHLIFKRSDLTKESAHLRGEDIQLSTFKGTPKAILSAETVIFIEEDGSRKVLKDRNGVFANK